MRSTLPLPKWRQTTHHYKSKPSELKTLPTEHCFNDLLKKMYSIDVLFKETKRKIDFVTIVR